MKVLVVGGGGREHAIVYKLSQSKKIDRIYCAPGNGGIDSIAQCVDIKATDIEKMVEFAKTEKMDFIVVAPDDPLSLGMVDAMENNGLKAFGPYKNAAQIESSKVFSKNLMKKYGIPTAEYEVFNNPDDAKVYLSHCNIPVVIKADGLALGKGVIIALDRKEAFDAVDLIMNDRKFGKSGDSIVVEEYMEGREVTVLAFTDGKSIIPMLSSQDHKRVFDEDKGLNTGGMGAFCPSPLYTDDLAKICHEKIYLPTLNALNREGILYKGVIYFGLMLTDKGPKVVEYNARFGDPEAQAILPLLKTDLMTIFEAVREQRLSEINIEWEDSSCACIMLSSGGYPLEYEKDHLITGLDYDFPEDLYIFHSGTKRKGQSYFTDGGRVIGVTAKEKTLSLAIEKAYNAVGKIYFKDMHYRRDIGKK